MKDEESGGERGDRSGFGAPLQLAGLWAAAGAAIGAVAGMLVGELVTGAVIGFVAGALAGTLYDARRMFRR